jgi:hypothetical protein
VPDFGWSYPPGCSGPPDGPLERVCVCGCLESDHDEDTGICGSAVCGCESAGFRPAPEPPDSLLELAAEYAGGPIDGDLGFDGSSDLDDSDVDDGGVEDVEVDRLPDDDL